MMFESADEETNLGIKIPVTHFQVQKTAMTIVG
jgi:hypothetical protein